MTSTGMHVFIDTNIFLNFYHFTNEDIEQLETVFASHEEGSIQVHVTQQLQDEFNRNREAKILDAMKQFQRFSTSMEMPHFMKDFSQYREIRDHLDGLKKAIKSIEKESKLTIKDRKLKADILIDRIF